jgi:SPP1 gp7 family putative phage head morphogenesis protein
MTLEQNLNKFDDQADKLAELTEKELIKAYSSVLKEIKGYMAEIYEKYGTAEKLTYTDMQKYKRMATLEEELKKRLMVLTGKNAKVLEQTLKDIYELAYYGTGFSLDQAVYDELGASVGYLPVSDSVVIAAIHNPIAGLTLNERLEKHRMDLTYSLKQEIVQGLILGESYQKVAKRLQDKFEGDAAKAVKVAQTESHRIKNAGRFDSMQYAQAKGINLKKRWVSTLDKKTRKRHQTLDGQQIGLEEPFKSGGAEAMYPGSFGVASQDINCRCTYISVIEGYEPEVRAARGTDGKTKVIKYTNYEEWKKANVEG